MTNRKTKIGITIIAILAGLLLTEAGYFFWVFSRAVVIPKNLEADAVVVFNGSPNRVEAGHDIVQSMNTQYLVISPALKSQLAIYESTYKRPPNVQYIPEPLARTTLENAVYSRRIIERHNLKSPGQVLMTIQSREWNQSAVPLSSIDFQLYYRQTHTAQHFLWIAFLVLACLNWSSF